MQFDNLGGHVAAASICLKSGSTKRETRIPADLSSATSGAIRLCPPGDVEAAFGGHLFAAFRHQAGGVWPMSQCDGAASLRCAAISRLSGRPRLLGQCHEAIDVCVGDVPPILAQVGGDAVGPGLHGDLRRPGRIRIGLSARVANGGHVVDVDAQAQAGCRHADNLRLPGSSAGMAASSGGSESAGQDGTSSLAKAIIGAPQSARPPDRSTTHAAQTTSPPAARIASTVSREESPVVTMSSTIATRSPGSRWNPLRNLQFSAFPLDVDRRNAQMTRGLITGNDPAHRRRYADVDLANLRPDRRRQSATQPLAPLGMHEDEVFLQENAGVKSGR